MSQDGNDSLESGSRTSSVIITRLLRTLDDSAYNGCEDVTSDISHTAKAPPTINIRQTSDNAWNKLGTIPPLGFTIDGLHALEDALGVIPTQHDNQMDGSDSMSNKQNKPFRKWMNTIRRRAAHRHTVMGVFDDDPMQLPQLAGNPSKIRRAAHRHSSSGSSFGFVASVKSATISMATASILARSRRTTLRSSQACSRTDRSSRASISGNRASEDSSCLERSLVMDKAVVERSLQRRRILEELINTEEGYIGDVRFLMNVSFVYYCSFFAMLMTVQVYVTILVSLPTLPMRLRSSINRNLADIVELHEEILGELHHAVPHSEYTQLEVATPGSKVATGHHRWRSLDAVPEDNDGMGWLDAVPGMIADPQVAADVARIFSRKV